MEFFDSFINRQTERMIYMFLIGMVVGIVTTFLNKIVQTYLPSITVHAMSVHSCEASDECFNKLTHNTSVLSFDDSTMKAASASSSSSYIVAELNTGNIILGNNIHEKKQIASLTKLMTAVLVEDLLPAGTLLQASKAASEQIPTKIGIKEGMRFTKEELLPAMLLTSANDAAAVLAEGIEYQYGTGSFIHAMNTKAKSIGMLETEFDNAEGFDSIHNFSTPKDLAVLSKYILDSYPSLTSLMEKSSVTLPENRYHPEITLYNWNGLLGVYPGVYGLKIGNTPEAGRTAIYAAKRSTDTLLVVVLGSTVMSERDLLAAKLLDEGFENKQHLFPVNVNLSMLNTKYSSWPSSH